MKGPSTTTVDAGGASVLPGFNDSHVHFLSGAQSLQELDLSGARTLEEVQQRIRDFAAANPGAPGFRGRGWNYGPFPGGLPTRAQLDAAVADRPVALVCFDGHSTWVNSRALEAAGITADRRTRRTEKSRGGRDAGARRPAQGGGPGACPRACRNRPGRSSGAAGRGYRARASLGVTSIQNASGNEDEFALYEEARAAGELSLRVYSSLSVSPGFTEADAQRFEEHPPPDQLRRALQGRRRQADGRRCDRDEHRGHAGPVCQQPVDLRCAQLRTARAGSHRPPAGPMGWQIWIHAIGDAGVRWPSTPSTMPPWPIPRRHARRATASSTSRPSTGRRRAFWPAGRDRVDAAAAHAADEIREPTRPVGGQHRLGAPVARLDVEGDHGARRAARLRQRLAGGVAQPVGGGLGGSRPRRPRGVPNQRLSLAEMIDGYASRAAYASFDEDRKGRLGCRSARRCRRPHPRHFRAPARVRRRPAGRSDDLRWQSRLQEVGGRDQGAGSRF